MNRTIKFRGWDKEAKKMIFEVWVNQHAVGIDPACDKLRTIDDFPVMQFTGLKDKNGKEIYEGDLIHIVAEGTDDIAQMIWNETLPCYKMKAPNQDYAVFKVDEPLWEVIGNIYENPKLLK